MAGKKSIGILNALITADATQLMREFNRVDRQVARTSASFTKPGAKLALGFLGVQNGLSAVANEVRHVVQNIESIPDVPASTVASIITMRDNLDSAKTKIDQMTAGMVGFGVQVAQAVGVGAASLLGYNDTSGLSRQETPDEIARAKDQNFYSKIDAARKRLTESTKAAALATADEAKQIILLRKEAEALETFSKGSSRNSVERLEAQAAAQDKLKEANIKMAALNKELAASEDQVREAMTGVYTATVSRADAIAGLENRSQRIFNDLGGTSPNPKDPENVQNRIRLNLELADTQKRLGVLYKENARAAQFLGETIASGFTEGIFSGQNFSQIMRGIATDIAKVIIKQTFLNAIMGAMGGGLGAGVGKLFGGFFADGGRPDIGKASIVGERGPELFIPDAAGTIVPNSALATSGSSRGGDNYTFQYTFESGVTRQEIAGLIPSIVRASAGIVADKVQRGGAYKKAFA